MTTTKNNEHKKLNVPNLRFPEFEGEWEEHYLSDYLDFKNGLNPKPDKFGKGIKFISVMDILNNAIITNDCIRASVDVSEEELQNFCVGYGDILFQRSSETLEDVGRANVYMDDKPAVFGGFVIRGKKKAEFNPLFFRDLLASPFARKKIIPMGAGAQHFNIGQEGLNKVKLNFPNLKEQEKIGRFLTLLDKRIATQSKVIDKLQSLIKGIMANLQKRGLKNNTWGKISLCDVLAERKELNKQLYPVFSVSVSQGVINQIEYLGRSFAAKDTSKYHVVYYGDIIYTKSPTGDFPYGIVKQNYNQEKVAVSPLYGVYVPKSYSIGVFLHEYFKSNVNTYNYLHPLIQKGAKNTINITNQHFLENKVAMPLVEQELVRISNLILSLNAKIMLMQYLKDKYGRQKQYLLRQMFV